MKAWLYILKCADGSYSTGSTNNLSWRIAQHGASEGSEYTRHRLPVELVYAEEFPSEHQAFLRERQVKGWSRAKKQALMRGDFKALVDLSGSRPSSVVGDQARDGQGDSGSQTAKAILRQAQDDFCSSLAGVP